MVSLKLRMQLKQCGVIKMNGNILSEDSKAKVHLIVEYIKQFSFCFEQAEVMDNPYEVLSHFGIFDELAFEEEEILVEELLGLAEAFEEREAVFWAECNRLTSV